MSDSAEGTDLRSSTKGAAIRTIRLIQRLFVEMPQPAKTFVRLFLGFFLLAFLVAALRGPGWLVLVVFALAGISIFSFGFCIFRDISSAASAWSRMYKESKGIPQEGFTFADLPTIKFMGFMYMVMGIVSLVGVTVAALK